MEQRTKSSSSSLSVQPPSLVHHRTATPLPSFPPEARPDQTATPENPAELPREPAQRRRSRWCPVLCCFAPGEDSSTEDYDAAAVPTTGPAASGSRGEGGVGRVAFESVFGGQAGTLSSLASSSSNAAGESLGSSVEAEPTDSAVVVDASASTDYVPRDPAETQDDVVAYIGTQFED